MATDSGDVAGNFVGGRQYFVLIANDLQFMQTSSGNIISDRDDIKDLQIPVGQP